MRLASLLVVGRFVGRNYYYGTGIPGDPSFTSSRYSFRYGQRLAAHRSHGLVRCHWRCPTSGSDQNKVRTIIRRLPLTRFPVNFSVNFEAAAAKAAISKEPPLTELSVHIFRLKFSLFPNRPRETIGITARTFEVNPGTSSAYIRRDPPCPEIVRNPLQLEAYSKLSFPQT